MFNRKLLASKMTSPVSSLFRRAKHFSTKHLQVNIFAGIIPKTIPVISSKFDFTNPISPGYNTTISTIISTFKMYDPVTKIPSANKKGPECCPTNYFLVDYMVTDDEGQKKDFQVLYDRMGGNPLGIVVGAILYEMEEFDVPMKLLPSHIKDLQPTGSNLGSLVPSARKDVQFSSVSIRRALLTLSDGYNPRDSYNWNQALKILITITTDVFRFNIAREFALDCLKRVGNDTVRISQNMEVITSNWDSISKRIWGSEYPFDLNGDVSQDSVAPFSENLACISVSLLTSNKKAKAKPKPKPDYDGSRKKKGKASLQKFGKKKKGESSSGSSESTDDAAAGKASLQKFGKKKRGESSSGSSESTDDAAAGVACLSVYWKSSSNSEAAGEVSASVNEVEEIQEVAD